MASARNVTAGFFPLDDELGLLKGELTPRLQEGLVRLSTHIPSFAKAAKEFAFFTQVALDRTTAARLSEAAGATAVALQTAEAERILRTHPPAPEGAEQLLFSVDGAMVPLVGGVWAEARTLVVGEPVVATNAEESQVVQTRALSYFSRLADSSSFGELATSEIHRRGIETAKRVGVVVDGAEWCQTFIELHAPEATRILDFAHAASYIDAIGQTLGAEGELLSEQERSSLCHELKKSGPSSVVERLRTIVAQAGAPGQTSTQLAYLEKREAQMDYPHFVAEQWPIGSGMVESANKLVVEERLKGAGMHWAEQNVNPMLALRNAICSDRWEEVWRQIEDEQRRVERARRRQRQRQRRVSATWQAAERSAAEAKERLQGTRHESGERASVGEAAERPVAEKGRPADNHPWHKPWSLRRQREIALSV